MKPVDPSGVKIEGVWTQKSESESLHPSHPSSFLWLAWWKVLPRRANRATILHGGSLVCCGNTKAALPQEGFLWVALNQDRSPLFALRGQAPGRCSSFAKGELPGASWRSALQRGVSGSIAAAAAAAAAVFLKLANDTSKAAS